MQMMSGTLVNGCNALTSFTDPAASQIIANQDLVEYFKPANEEEYDAFEEDDGTEKSS